MKSGYYRTFSIFLAILFLFVSVVSRSQSVVPTINHVCITAYNQVADHTVANSTQLVVEEKEGKDADSVTGSFALLYIINVFSFPNYNGKQYYSILIDSVLYSSVPRFIAICTLLI